MNNEAGPISREKVEDRQLIMHRRTVRGPSGHCKGKRRGIDRSCLDALRQ